MLSFRKNKMLVIGFLLPAFLFYTFFMIAPVLETSFLSFFKWKGIGGSEFYFVGLGNYLKVFRDAAFWASMGRLAYFVVLSVATQLVFGFLLAYLISLKFKGSRFFKLSFFLPAVLSVTAVSLMWRMILSTNDGMLNALLKAVGLESWARSWLTDPDICFTVITLINTWLQLPIVFVILLAGIVAIPPELYEAAAIDGVGSLKRVFHITLPLLLDVLGVCTILVLSNAMKAFDIFYVVTSGSFGPGGANMVPLGMMYITSFIGNDFGRGSVIALTVIVLGALVSGIVYFRGFEQKSSRS